MNQYLKFSIVFIIVVVIFIYGIFALEKKESPNIAKYNELASCLEDKGAVFYGAFWCPACAQQKAIFGKASKSLPYKECSNHDRSQNELCDEEGIHSYPTWKFADGDRCPGVVNPELLAYKSSCIFTDEKNITGNDLFNHLVLNPYKRQISNQLTKEQKDEIDVAIAEQIEIYEEELDDRFNVPLENSTREQILEIVESQRCLNDELFIEALKFQELNNVEIENIEVEEVEVEDNEKDDQMDVYYDEVEEN